MPTWIREVERVVADVWDTQHRVPTTTGAGRRAVAGRGILRHPLSGGPGRDAAPGARRLGSVEYSYESRRGFATVLRQARFRV